MSAYHDKKHYYANKFIYGMAMFRYKKSKNINLALRAVFVEYPHLFEGQPQEKEQLAKNHVSEIRYIFAMLDRRIDE